MSLFNKFTLIFAGLLLFSACEDFLELEPISQIGDNGFYTNTSEVESAVLAIYDGMQSAVQREFALTEMRSDNTRTRTSEGEWAQFETLNVDPTNGTLADYWASWYNVIFRANTVLDNLEAVEDASTRSQFEGEARFARAMAHFNLVRLFGDVPLIDRVIFQSDTEAFGRTSSDQVYAAIISDLEAAAATLPTRTQIAEGRATRGAANALLGKVFLTTGDYSKAQAALEDVIDSGNYQLVDDYRDVFYSERNDEIIFAIQFVDDNENDSQDFSLEMTALGRAAGINFATDDFIDALTEADSMRAAVLFDPEDMAAVGKYLTSSADAELGGNDWIVLRYADVLLMYAEAILAGGESTTDSEALDAVNAVRDRAGLDDLDEVTKDNLLYERRIELAFENQRFFDLLRFGVAQEVLSDFAEEEGFSFSPTDLLLPIPQREINVSQGQLSQNPGY